MPRHLRSWRHYMGGFPTEETALVQVDNGRVTVAFDDGDRIQFDAQELLGAVELQLLSDRRGTSA